MHGIHHVTAITATIKDNVAFYTQVLGLRLVKKTVNQDDTSAYHMFYADAVGSPGTDMTFFDWPQSQEKKLGTDTISCTLFRVTSRKALEFWIARFDSYKIWHSDIELVGALEQIRFEDREGQSLGIVCDSTSPVEGVAWEAEGIETDFALRGFYGVELTVPTLEHLHFIFTKVLGWETNDAVAVNNESYRSISTYSIGEGGCGKTVRVILDDRLDPAWDSRAGGVHHVAFRVKDEQELRQWQSKLSEFHLPNSGLVERYYFTSLYFRVSPGILFELATDGPGFTADEPLETLGQALSLPPFLEPKRDEIEAKLKPLG